MRIALRYFSGTGNSWKIMHTCQTFFEQQGHQVEMLEIKTNESVIPEASIIGFCFPVYAFGIPRICLNYLKCLKRSETKQKIFVLITAGNQDQSGFAVSECRRIVKLKNGDLFYSDVIQMPINWTTSPKPPFPPSKDEAKIIIERGVAHAKKCASQIIEEKRHKHRFKLPYRYPILKFFWDYWSFKYLGIQNMWRMFKTYESCTGCGLCEKKCPTGSVSLIGGKPVWSSTCEQCMRCVNFCPQEAIYQNFGGETKGKNKYIEPDFKQSIL
jgi:ferredoxin